MAQLRKIRVEGDKAFVPLTGGFEAIIDAEDVEIICNFNWYASKVKRTQYAARNGKSGEPGTIYMHRVLLQSEKEHHVDHVNGDGLDNRKCNLRKCNHAENARNASLSSKNKSGLKGVSWIKGQSKWRATIMVNGKSIYLGNFDTPEAAHDAYCIASKKYHGKYGRT